MRITSKGRYALRALIVIANHDGDSPVSIKKITQQENLSPIYLEQIFTKLKKHGIVKSLRGIVGGFFLARKTDQITLFDILNAVEDNIQLTPCCTPSNCSSDFDPAEKCDHYSFCKLTNFWNDLNGQTEELFQSYTLEKIIKKYAS